ncbi:MAG: hypothetical protein MJ173_05530 [Clostridia bacterium]|nr:hypothetical protein [Clostridia bacterium]
MFNKKTRKGSVAASVVSLVLCCVMLLGTTFAWFSTSVSSSVNAIQSGSLKIDLVDENGKSLVGDTIAIESKEGFTTTYWEPGCEATFQDVFVKNESNIDVKYEIKVVGLDGDAKLLDAITFEDNTADFAAGATLAAGETSDAIKISAKMDENAGNQYQNLTADGIAVVVYATQVNANAEYAKVSAAVKPLDVTTIEDVELNTAYTFVPAEADEETYSTWNADFVVWFDSDVEAGAVTLAGQYDSYSEDWEVQTVNTAIEADQQIRLLESRGAYINYNEILENVGEFNCGAASTQTGLKMNVELRLYEVKNGAETGEYVVAGSYTYTF